MTQAKAKLNKTSPVPHIRVPIRQATRDDLHVVANKFFVDSQLHGFREAYTAKSIWSRVFWVSVCLICFAAAIFEVGRIVSIYVNGTAATQISVVSTPKMTYPVTLVCPTAWISKAKLRKHGFDEDKRYIEYLAQYLHQRDNPGSDDEENVHYDIIGMIIEGVYMNPPLEKLFKQFKRYDRVLQSIAVEPKIQCKGCYRQNISEHTMDTGVCFMATFKQLDYYVDSIPSITYSWTDDAYLWKKDDKGLKMSFHTTKNDISFSRDSHIIFAPVNTTVLVLLEMQVTNKISIKSSPCSPMDAIHFKVCQADCVDTIYNTGCFGCSTRGMMSARQPYDLCRLVDNCRRNQTLSELTKKKLSSCMETCIPPCRETLYSVHSSMISNSKRKNSTKVSLKYQSSSYTLLEDISTLGFDAFVSSIGGQLGLWCGASVISLFQLISFVVCPCIYCKEKAAESKILRTLSRRISSRVPSSPRPQDTLQVV